MTVYEKINQTSAYTDFNSSSTHNCLKSSNEPQYPVVSIIIAAYNSEKFIERCLNSAINQSFEAIEIVCVDDGSTDNTAKIVFDLSLSNRNIKPESVSPSPAPRVSPFWGANLGAWVVD